MSSVLPISPSFLSLSSEYNDMFAPEESSDKFFRYNPNEHGLLDLNTIRGFLTVMSSDLQLNSQLPLFQLLPPNVTICDGMTESVVDDNQYLRNILGDKKLVRIDAHDVFNGNPYCEKYKRQTKAKGCIVPDSRVLLLFHRSLCEYDIRNGIDGYIKQFRRICHEYFNKELKKTIHCNVRKCADGKRFYFRYICECSGLLEYAFPIFHNGRIIAVTMIGQRIPKGMKNDGIFAEYRSMHPSFNKLLSGLSLPDGSFKRLEAKKGLIDSICIRLSDFEKIIDARVIERADEIISNTFNRIENEFREELGNSAYEVVLNNTFSKICECFDPSACIYAYARGLKIYQTDQKAEIFHLIGKRSKISVHDQFEFEGDKTLRGDITKNIIRNAKDKGINLDIREGIKYHCVNDFLPDLTIIMGEYFAGWKEKYEKQFGIFYRYLESIYHSLFEPYNIIQAKGLNTNLENSMRITVHEASNVLPTIQATLSRELRLDLYGDYYLNNPERLASGTMRSLWDVYQRSRLLDGLYKRSTFVFKDNEPKFAYTDFHRLLYSVRTLFDKKAEKDKFQRIIINMDPIFNHYLLYTDKELFDHILFNLVDNAVKYGYHGTNIYIDVSSSYGRYDDINNLDLLTVTVSSYGDAISDTDKEQIFNLFYRVNKYDVQGMGIGLFLVKKMCDAMGYEVKPPESSRICDFHIPIHYFYSQKQRKSITNVCFGEILSKKIVSDLKDEVINTNIVWDVGSRETSSFLAKPTYKNSFSFVMKSPSIEKPLLIIK